MSRYSYGKDINYWDWVFMRSEKIFFNKKPKIFVPVHEFKGRKQIIDLNFTQN